MIHMTAVTQRLYWEIFFTTRTFTLVPGHLGTYRNTPGYKLGKRRPAWFLEQSHPYRIRLPSVVAEELADCVVIASSRLSITLWTSACDRIDTLPAESMSWIGITRLSLPLLLLPVFYAFFAATSFPVPPLFKQDGNCAGC